MNKIAAYAPLLEKIFLAGLLLGVVLTLLHVTPFDASVTIVSLYGLGAACYFSAFQRFDVPESEDSERRGFMMLLGFVILPKVFWISAAVSLIGIAMFFMGTPAEGYRQMVFIGATTIASALVIMGVLSLRGGNVIKPLLPALLRAIPLLIADIYLLTR